MDEELEAMLAAHNSKANAAAAARAAARVADKRTQAPLAPVPRNGSRPNGGGGPRGGKADLNAGGKERVQGASVLTSAQAKPPARSQAVGAGSRSQHGAQAEEEDFDRLLQAHNASASREAAPRVHAVKRTVSVKAISAWEKREGLPRGAFGTLCHEEREAVTLQLLAGDAC